jgi:hypothetical protein
MGFLMPDIPTPAPPQAPPPPTPMAPPVNPGGAQKPKRKPGITPPSLIGGGGDAMGGATQGAYGTKTLLGQ